jgi:hypothetical protein
MTWILTNVCWTMIASGARTGTISKLHRGQRSGSHSATRWAHTVF